MVHGQVIGIPFRRRKGEQAPPPPKEVAWNPTIESNLPYKEVKYFKFVEGAGWQALNIGEILPVGQRVMIRIVMTEPYYEVSKAVSSQMTNIQIGKNGVSEYDIVGTLTVYSPQILTVTIGVDKNYVQWNPVVESNAKYAFGGYINVERVNRPENITYQTTESYNGIPIIKGSGIDTKGLVIGAVTNNYWKGIFYKLMLYSKTIDMLSINALKNLFALDILIDINHPIFKK